MEDLNIKGEKGTFFTPNIQFSATSGICEINGESYLENTFAFYEPLMNWLKEFNSTVQKPITLNIGLTYFNTASSRSLLDILLLLKEYKDNGSEVSVNWSVQAWDEDMQQEIEDFALDTDLEINIIQVDEKTTSEG